MTNIELVLTLFTAAAVLSVVTIVAAAFWSHSRSDARERMEPAYEAGEPQHAWLGDQNRT
jgi:HAMP domain-containing protein